MTNGAALPAERGTRIAAIDIMRGTGMLLVVLGHALLLFFENSYARNDANSIFIWKFIYSFHMPLFFFISGMVSHNLSKTPRGKVFRSSLYLFFLATFSQILAFPLAIALHHKGSVFAMVSAVFSPLLLGTGYALTLPWFLYALAIVRILWYFAAKASFFQKILFFAVLFALYMASLTFSIRAFGIHHLFFDLIFFAAGSLTFEGWNKIEGVVSPLWCLGLSGVMFLAVRFTFLLNHGCLLGYSTPCASSGTHVVDMNGGAYGYLPLFFLTSFCGIAMVIFFATGCRSWKSAHWLVYAGEKTLPLLFLNAVTYSFIEILIDKALPARAFYFPASLLIALILTAVQLACLPLAARIFHPFDSYCKKFAQRVGDVLFGTEAS